MGRGGFAHPDTYSALIELASPVARDAGEGVAALSALRARVRAAGGTVIGAGIHPDGAFGDVVHVDEPRYHRIVEQLQGLIRRTPTCALHVHVGMPDAATAIRVFNGLREQLPLLQALAANSPFWHGRDSGLATARAQLFRGYPRAEIPRAFDSYDDYAETVAGRRRGRRPARLHLPVVGHPPAPAPGHGRGARDGQPVGAVVGGRAGRARARRWRAPRRTSARDAWLPREVLMEASFTAARDGLRARLPMDGALRPAPEVARAALERARPHAAELGSGDALEGIERILAEGNGADRQRAAHARGGMPALLDLLVAEAEEAYG